MSDVATDETTSLISADKVTGTNVYNRQGEKLGSVYDDVMINKLNGQVAFAIMSFGGFLGMDESYHPLPWRALTYDTRQGGYVVDVARNRLEKAPYYAAGSEPNRAGLASHAAPPAAQPAATVVYGSIAYHCTNCGYGRSYSQDLAFRLNTPPADNPRALSTKFFPGPGRKQPPSEAAPSP